MCSFSRPSPPPPPPPPPPAPVAVTPESNEIVSGSQNRKRALAGAAGRRANILTSSSGVLGDANVGKTLLGS